MQVLIALDEHIVNRIIELVEDHRGEVESGSTIVDQPRDLELHDMDVALAALRSAEDRSDAFATQRDGTLWPDPDARPTY